MEGCLNASFLFYCFLVVVKHFLNVMPFVKVPLCQKYMYLVLSEVSLKHKHMHIVLSEVSLD